MSDDTLYKWDVFFGYIQLEERQVPMPDGSIHFQGRSKHYGRNGELQKVTDWETTCIMYWPKPEPKPSLLDRVKNLFRV